jgi:hypothetical protein
VLEPHRGVLCRSCRVLLTAALERAQSGAATSALAV